MAEASEKRKRPKPGAGGLARRDEELSARLAEAEEALRAIRGGEVDALLVSGKDGERVFTLTGAERPYRILIEAMGEGALTLSRDGTVLFANQAFARIVGRPLEQVLGASLARFLPKEKGPDLAALLAEGAAGSHRQEAVLLSEAGVEVPVLLTAAPLPESDPPQVCLVVTDLAEQRRREAELTRLYEGLRESEAAVRQEVAFRKAIESSLRIGLAAVDLSGRIIHINDAFCAMTGWSKEELLGTGPPHPFWPPEEAEKIGALLAGFLSGDKVPEPAELRFMRRGGERFCVRHHPSPLRDQSGVLKGLVASFEDITSLKKMERIALNQEKMASLGQVATGVAHEIRNPLSGINLYLHSLETFLGEVEIPNPEIRETTGTVIASMKAASVRMEAVIQRVLSFSRPGPPRMEPLDINTRIREAVAMAKLSLQKSGARVAVALAEDLPRVRGDARLLEQVVLNLLTNAAQALEGKKEGTEKAIAVASALEDGYVLVTVADSGPGVPPHLREKIFDPFFTTKKEGTGIGLALTHRIVADHGGFIRVGQSPLDGALFTIGLPAGSERETPSP